MITACQIFPDLSLGIITLMTCGFMGQAEWFVRVIAAIKSIVHFVSTIVVEKDVLPKNSLKRYLITEHAPRSAIQTHYTCLYNETTKTQRGIFSGLLSGAGELLLLLALMSSNSGSCFFRDSAYIYIGLTSFSRLWSAEMRKSESETKTE